MFEWIPQEKRDEYIDLSGLSEDEAKKEFVKIFGEGCTDFSKKTLPLWIDEMMSFPELESGDGYPKITEKTLFSHDRRELLNKTPKYVSQFGVNQINKRNKK